MSSPAAAAAKQESGKLNPKSFGEILKKLEGNRSAAFLLISDGLAEKCLYFSVGAIRLTSMGKRRAIRLEEALAAHEKVGSDAIERARIRQADTGEPLEEILAGAFNLNEVVRECSTAIVRDEVLDCLLWEGAQFEYAEANPPPKIFDPRLEAVKLSFGVPKLLKEAAEAVPKAQKLVNKITGRGKLIRGQQWAYGVPSDAEKAACEAVAAAIPEGGATWDDVVIGARKAGIDALRIADAVEKMLEAKTLDLQAKKTGAGTGLTKEEEVESARRDVNEIEGALDLIINELAARQRLAKGYLALGDQPKAVYNLKRVGDELLHRNKGDEAIDAFRQIVKIVPQDFAVREKIAYLFERMKRFPEAIGEGLDLAKLYKQFGLFNRAKNIFRRVINLDPENVDHRKDLIELLVKLKETPDAVAEYENLGEIYSRRQQENELLGVYRNILALDPTHQNARKSTMAIIRRRPGFWVPYVAIAAGFLILAVGGAYVSTEYRALEDYRAARKLAFERADAGDFPSAHSEIDHFLRKHDASRVSERARSLKTQLTTLERDRLERKAGAEFARALQLEQKGFVPQARDVFQQVERMAHGTKWATDAQARIKGIDTLSEEADRALRDVKRAENDKNLRDAFDRGRDLVRKYPWSDAAQRHMVRLRVETSPPGAQLTVDGRPVPGRTPCEVEQRVVGDSRKAEPFILTISKDGFTTETRQIDVREEVSYPYAVELKRALRWRATLLGPIEAPPLVEEDAVYVAGRDQRVYALDPKEVDESGRVKVRWVFALGIFGEVVAKPVRAGARLVVGDKTGAVTAIDVASGKLAWRARVRGPAQPVCAPNETLVVVAEEEALVGLDTATGKERWRAKIAGGIAAPPVAADRDAIVVVPTGDSALVIVDAVTGAVRGAPLNTMARATAAVGISGMGYVVATEDNLVRFIARDGRPKWTLKAPGTVVAAPLVVGNTAYVGAGNALMAIDLQEGQERWARQEYRSAIRASPAYRAGGNRLYVATGDGAVYALTAETGTLMWSYRTAGEIVAQPIALASTVYIASTDFGVYAIRD